MPVVFEGSRLRIDRAYGHGKALTKLWSEIPAEDLYTVSAKVNPDGKGSIRLTRPKPFSSIFALKIGEMLYQLRSALDGAIYEAAVRDSGQDPPPNEANLEFPIFPKRRDYLKKAALKIAPLDKKRRDIVESVQLYNAPKLPPEKLVMNGHRNLVILNDWARRDRHRRLHVVGSWVSQASPQIRFPDGATAGSIKLVKSGGFLEDDNVIATFRVGGYVRGMKVEANAYVSTEIGINEIPLPCAPNDTLQNRLYGMLNAVSFAVNKIEDSF